MFLDLWKIVCDIVRRLKLEPPKPPSRSQFLFCVLLVVASFYGGWVSFEHSAKEKLLVQEGAAAEARAKREDEEKKLVQQREEQEMKSAQEREEQQKQFAQKQKELFDQAFSSTPRESQ